MFSIKTTREEVFTKIQVDRRGPDGKLRPLALFLDYDGTLTPFVNLPAMATLSEPAKSILARLRKKIAYLVIVSGRPCEFLEAQTKSFDIHLAAEHGALFFDPSSESWTEPYPLPRVIFPEQFIEDFQTLSSLNPGTWIEQKRFSLVFHFRQADVDEKTLASDVHNILKKHRTPYFRVYEGNCILEIKHQDVGKGKFLAWFLETFAKKSSHLHPPYPLTIGDDYTDEDMFAEVNKAGGVSIKVGSGNSQAQYRLPDVESVLTLLDSICDALEFHPDLPLR